MGGMVGLWEFCFLKERNLREALCFASATDTTEKENADADDTVRVAHTSCSICHSAHEYIQSFLLILLPYHSFIFHQKLLAQYKYLFASFTDIIFVN